MVDILAMVKVGKRISLLPAMSHGKLIGEVGSAGLFGAGDVL